MLDEAPGRGTTGGRDGGTIACAVAVGGPVGNWSREMIPNMQIQTNANAFRRGARDALVPTTDMSAILRWLRDVAYGLSLAAAARSSLDPVQGARRVRAQPTRTGR